MTVRVSRDGSHHWAGTCPCPDCLRERERQKLPPKFPLLHIPFRAAYLFGLVKRRSRCGSVVRDIVNEQQLNKKH